MGHIKFGGVLGEEWGIKKNLLQLQIQEGPDEDRPRIQEQELINHFFGAQLSE